MFVEDEAEEETAAMRSEDADNDEATGDCVDRFERNLRFPCFGECFDEGDGDEEDEPPTWEQRVAEDLARPQDDAPMSAAEPAKKRTVKEAQRDALMRLRLAREGKTPPQEEEEQEEEEQEQERPKRKRRLRRLSEVESSSSEEGEKLQEETFEVRNARATLWTRCLRARTRNYGNLRVGSATRPTAAWIEEPFGELVALPRGWRAEFVAPDGVRHQATSLRLRRLLCGNAAGQVFVATPLA